MKENEAKIDEHEPPKKKPKISKTNKDRLSASSILDFAFLLGNLKQTKRSGWIRKKIAQPESIADHMYRMGVLSMILTSECKVVQMALIHEVMEAICGDIIPIEKISRVSKAEKYKAESDAMIKIKNEYLNGSEIG